MDIVILTKRGISFQKVRRGEQQVILIPSDESIKVYKDITENHAIAERYGADGKPPLWREQGGQATVYGVLPDSLSQRRQALKVWLAEDFAPRDSTAIMYVFEKWVVFSRREVDDEGHHGWRTTLLKADEDETGDITTLITTTLGDLMLDDVESRVCVAVYEDLKLYEHLQSALEPLGIKPVPFSTLKIGQRIKPLYRQRDFSLMMAMSILLTLGLLAAMSAYWFVNWLEQNRLTNKISEVRQQIQGIEVNQSIGQLREPDQILQAMQKAFEQKPSSIIDAAARFGREFGELETVSFQVGAADLQPTDTVNLMEPGQHQVDVSVVNPTNKLLVDQERLARVLLADAPWVRRVENLPLGQNVLTLKVVLQTDPTEEPLP